MFWKIRVTQAACTQRSLFCSWLTGNLALLWQLMHLAFWVQLHGLCISPAFLPHTFTGVLSGLHCLSYLIFLITFPFRFVWSVPSTGITAWQTWHHFFSHLMCPQSAAVTLTFEWFAMAECRLFLKKIHWTMKKCHTLQYFCSRERFNYFCCLAFFCFSIDF